MQYLPVMDVLQRKTYLCKPVEHMILAPILQLPSIFLLDLILLFDLALEVTTVGIVHDNAQLALLGLVDLLESDNVGMLQHFQNLGLSKGLPSLIFGHALDIDLLDHCVLLVRLALH